MLAQPWHGELPSYPPGLLHPSTHTYVMSTRNSNFKLKMVISIFRNVHMQFEGVQKKIKREIRAPSMFIKSKKTAAGLFQQSYNREFMLSVVFFESKAPASPPPEPLACEPLPPQRYHRPSHHPSCDIKIYYVTCMWYITLV